MTTYIIITIAVILIVIILSFTKYPSKEKPKSIMDKLNEDPNFKQMQDLFKAMEGLNSEGTDKDEMPEGIGEFGLEVTNPIPVNTVFGSAAYLNRLRTMEGVKVEYDRVVSVRADNISSIIDSYELTAIGKRIATIYICPYNKKNSDKAPRGFKLTGQIIT